MKIRLFIVAALVSTWFACQCGGGPASLCDGVACGPGLACDSSTGRCGVLGAGAGTGGGSGGGGAGGGSPATCSPACSGATPVCDPVTTTCKTCTFNQGCSGSTPICDTSANAGSGRCAICNASSGCPASAPFCDPAVPPVGVCYQCRTQQDCTASGDTCDPSTNICVPDDGGFGGGGGSGGGSGGGGSGGGGTVYVPPVLEFDDAGLSAHCLPFDGGTKACVGGQCDRGFECLGGQCVLHGGGGPLQVTLRFPVDEDVDLHLLEPVTGGGTCEIWYGNTNYYPPPPFPVPFPLPHPPSCGAKGWLDLDSNPACRIDSVDIENLIYPTNQSATHGLYTVRVDYYQNCAATTPVPYEVEVRGNGTSRFYCGTFQPNQADMGSANSGRTITTFTVQ